MNQRALRIAFRALSPVGPVAFVLCVLLFIAESLWSLRHVRRLR